MMRNFIVVLMVTVFALDVCFAKEYFDKIDRYLIACHTTDFVCFKRQYISLRDHVFLGNSKIGVPFYEPYYFQYGDSGTCVKMSGLEESSLVGIGMDSDHREYTLVLELPLRLQQVANDTKCVPPEKEFLDIEALSGPLKKFVGNATIQVVFPYDLKRKKSHTFMLMKDEGLDVILDIPDLSDFKTLSDDDRLQYELSEWAYEVVQHINAAQAFALPYTSNMRPFAEKIPLEKYLLLYPEEEYTDIHFTYSETPFFEKNMQQNEVSEE